MVSIKATFIMPAVFLLLSGISAGVSADESESVYKLAERFYSDSLYNLALEQYQKYIALKRTPERDAPAFYKIALCHRQLKNIRPAVEAFEEYIKLFPSEQDVMDAMFFAGSGRRDLEEFKAASEWFYLVWSRFVGSALAQRALFDAAECAYKGAMPQRATELFDLYVQKFPKHEKAKEAALYLARLLIDRAEYTRASETIRQATAQWGGDKTYLARISYVQALLAGKLDDRVAAGSAFTAMYKTGEIRFPEAQDAYREYIRHLIRGGRQKDALTVFPVLTDILGGKGLKPDFGTVYEWAECARTAREFDQAIGLYTALLSPSPDKKLERDIKFRIAQCHIGKNEITRAIETLQNIAAGDSVDEYGPRAVLAIGNLYFERKLFTSAISAYQQYLELPDPANKDLVLYRIANIYQKQFDRYGSAIREYENLLKRYPGSLFFHKASIGIAECYEARGEFDAAIRQYNFLLESEAPEDLATIAQSRIQYLTTYRIQDNQAAVGDLVELLLSERDSVDQLSRLMTLARIYEKRLKQYEKALEAYGEILKREPSAGDSVRSEALFRMGRNYQYLAEKAETENSMETAAFAKKKCLDLYAEVIAAYPASVWADEAAFRTMMITTPTIAEFEHFITRFPDSRYQAEVLFSIAKHYENRARTVDKKFCEKAIEAYDGLVRRFPASTFVPQALIGLAWNYYAIERMDSAMTAAGELQRRFPESDLKAEGLFVQGLVLKKQGDFAGAMETFKSILYQFPYSGLAGRTRYELAWVQLETDDIFEASSNFRTYLQNYPDSRYNKEARWGIGRCLVRSGNYAEARTTFTDLLNESPPEAVAAEIRYDLAVIAEKSGDINNALKYYNEVLSYSSYGRKDQVYLHVAGLYFDNRMFSEAVKAFRQAIDAVTTRADSVAAMRGHIVALIMDGKAAEADRSIAVFKDRFGGNTADVAEIIFHEGLRLVVDKQYDKAINRFAYIQAKYEESPRADDAAYQVALSHYYQGQKDRAMELFTAFPTRYPQSEFVPSAWFKIGMIFYEQNDFARAAEAFGKTASHPKVDGTTRFRALANAAVGYEKIAGWLDAARMYERILKEFPEQMPASSVQLKTGFALFQASRFDDALTYFEEANGNPRQEEKPEILYWIATTNAKIGNHQKAIAEYLKVPYLYAGIGKWGITAEYEAARLYERLGEYEKAVSLYRKVVRSDGERGEFGKNAALRIDRLNNLSTE